MKRLPASLLELRTRYVEGGRPLPATVETALAADPRAGARAILEAIAKRRRDNRAEGQRLRTMLRFETALWGSGVARIRLSIPACRRAASAIASWP